MTEINKEEIFEFDIYTNPQRLSIFRNAVRFVVDGSVSANYQTMKLKHPAYNHSRHAGVPDNLSEAEIRTGLETRLFGRTAFYFFDEIGSTNDHAAMLAGHGSQEGTVVIADRQSKGRGQKERTWFSPPGAGIYISLILRPVIPPGDAPKITLLTAVSVAETIISLTGLDVRIKWPNDILIKGKKIAGILSGMDAEMDMVNHVIVGVGINVNTRKEIMPAEIRNTATSVLIETGKETSRSGIARAFLKSFELLYTAFIHDGFEKILVRWKELSCIMGKQIQVKGTKSRLSGSVIDIDSDGVLILEDQEGVIHKISSGDILLS